MYNKFAQSMLKKYGWNEGDGLGRNNQGITQPIKASYKFDSHGISYKPINSDDIGKWSNIYSNTASQINVENDNCVSVIKKNDKEEKLKSAGFDLLYKNFTKSSMIFKDGLMIPESSDEKKPQKRKRKTRIDNDEDQRESSPPVKKKKKNTQKDDTKVSKHSKDTSITTDTINEEETVIEKKKKKKTKKKMENQVTEISKEINNESEENKSKKDKKKKSKEKENLEKKQLYVVQDSTFLTCHAAARCGISMSGKLARIQKLHEAEKSANLSIKSTN